MSWCLLLSYRHISICSSVCLFDRCRVYRQISDASIPPSVVLEASGTVEHCSGPDCEAGIFFGVSSERIVGYAAGDSFEARCLLAAPSTGTFLVDSAQFSFATL